MNRLSISEATSVQFPMVKHASEIGWGPLSPEIARQKRNGDAGMFLLDDLTERLIALNPGLVTRENVRSIIDRLEALPSTIEGNREMLAWMRGERQIYDEIEKRHRPVRLIDFDNPSANIFHVSWEWTIKPLSTRKGNRADVLFLVNGLPICIVEHKHPKDGGAIERAIKQLRRYEIETPELMAAPQLFNVTHLLDYWYGVTWNVTRRDMARWKQTPDEAYRFAVQSFFEPTDFLRTVRDWILFYVLDNETRKSILRQHQRRAIDAIIERCADPVKTRGLIWHTQGSGKTFTLLTAARLILENKSRFKMPTVLLVVDRTELEGQLKGWVDRLLGEMQQQDIAIKRANNKSELQELLDADFRGLIISMIHKFEAIEKNSLTRDNIYIFIDEAHRSVARDLGTYLMAAVPNATIIGFTGTPINQTEKGEGTFKIFGAQDELGYLDKYSIKESIEDETTLPIKHVLAPSNLTVPIEMLDKEFFNLAEAEGITDIEELNKALDRAVGLRAFLKGDERIANVAAYVTTHFQENVLPLGYKAFLVAVDREACAKYKQALDRLLPADWSEAVYSENVTDTIDRPLVAELQISEKREEDIRIAFKKPKENPKILIVTDKLLTGYDAPLLYCLYLDKPMRDHVLLQAIARVNRPYIDAEGVRKRIGLVIDFVSVTRELKKALRFDSSEVSGVIEDLDILLADFKVKIASAEKEYLDVGGAGDPDERLEKIVYGRFFEPEVRKVFYEDYKEIESLWEILSPSPELRDWITVFKRLTYLYASVRNAYAEKTGFVADLAYKTRKLVEETVNHTGLGNFTRSIIFDTQTLEALRRAKGANEGKVIDLVRGLRTEIDDNQDAAPILLPLKDRAERVLKDLESRKTTSMEALDMLATLAAEREAATKSMNESGLSPKAFSIFWALKEEPTLRDSQVNPMDLAKESELLMSRYPNANVNPEENRQLRTKLYTPLLKVKKEERNRLVDIIVSIATR